MESGIYPRRIVVSLLAVGAAVRLCEFYTG